MENAFQLAIQKQLTETLIQKAAQLPQNFNQTKFVQNCLSALDSIDDIEEVEPNEVDLAMLKEVEENSDCHEFISQEEAMKEWGL